MDTETIFADWLTIQRKQLDLTQDQLADEVGCSVSTIRKIETGKRRPSKQIAELIARTLNIPEKDHDRFINFARSVQRLNESEAPYKTSSAQPEPPSLETKPVKPFISSNLPFQATNFIGRGTELSTLENLVNDSTIRFITIVGLGGMGKSRLAISLAEKLLAQDTFKHGCYFVHLASLNNPDHIPTSIAEACNLSLDTQENQRSSSQQVLDYLHNKKMLLILDNFEHLLNGVEIVNQILSAAPEVKIIATSRERLSLQSEYVFRLEGLKTRLIGNQENIEGIEAAQLFYQSAKRINPEFRLTAENQHLITHVCTLVGGMPLAIELAAGWLDTLPLSAIETQIQKNLDLLNSNLRDLASRHHSIRAVLNGSWDRLNAAESKTLANFTVFRNGFTYEAATSILNVSLSTLKRFVDKSLLQYRPAQNRYQIHELMRQYLVEMKAKHDINQDSLLDQHSDYYLTLLHEQELILKGGNQRKALGSIENEFENIRAAWGRAVEHRQDGLLIKAAHSLGYFCKWSGRYLEGEQLFALASEGFNNNQAVQLFFSSWLAIFANINGDSEYADALLSSAYQFYKEEARHEIDDEMQKNKAFVSLHLGVHYLTKEIARADELLSQSLELYLDLNDEWGKANVTEQRGAVQFALANYDKAIDFLEDSRDAFSKSGDLRSLINVLEKLSRIGRYNGDSSLAIKYSEECLNVAKIIGSKPSYAQALDTLSSTYAIGHGDFSKAYQLQEECIEIYHELGDKKSLSISLARLGFYISGAGHLDKGEYYLREAIALLDGSTMKQWLAWTYQKLGIVLASKGQWSEAGLRFKESEDLYAELEIKDEHLVGSPYYVYLLRDQMSSQELFCEILKMQKEIYENRLHYPQLVLLKVLAALLSEQTLKEEELESAKAKLAIQLNALCNQSLVARNFAADSPFLHPPIHRLESLLPADFVAENVQIGSTMELWPTAVYLLEELPRLG